MFEHIVTLIGPGEEEVSFTIQTDTDRYLTVVNEINSQKDLRGLKGYRVFEVLPCDAPF